MSITLGTRSLSRLEGVHPDLVRVVKRAAMLAEPDQDFTVIEGVRSKTDMCVNYGKGRTIAQCTVKGVPGSYARPTLAKVTWLANPFKSKHAVHVDGFGHAVDLAPFPIDWNNAARFKELSTIMLSAAHQEGVTVVWGGNWASSPDTPHYELAA